MIWMCASADYTQDAGHEIGKHWMFEEFVNFQMMWFWWIFEETQKHLMGASNTRTSNSKPEKRLKIINRVTTM